MYRSSFLISLCILSLSLPCLTAESPWQSLEVPGAWEPQVGDHDGFAWYRAIVVVPAEWEGSRLLLTLRAADDVDEAYFNGERVGANGGMPPLFAKPSSDVRRPAVIDPTQIRYGLPNLVAFRVYDDGDAGGLIEGPIQLGRIDDAIDLSGTWDFILGDRRDYGTWPDNDPESAEAGIFLKEYARRHPVRPAGHRGIVPADREGRERDLALIRQRFEGNSNVHSNIDGKGQPLAPESAVAALDAGPALKVETVLHEPRVTQPLYIEFDARGRMWVTQYIQYPTPAGLQVLTWDSHLRTVFDTVPPPPPYDSEEKAKFRGRDLITIHEDTDGDGRYDRDHVFADGLNIVTSTCQGNGGVWVLNPPYLLFYSDADGDDQPDGPPVVHLSGFGLEDTHSVANSLKWGPDGWLYGCTGSTVTARVQVTSRPHEPSMPFFGQTIWRFHPDRQLFELFAEGGWNNFGVDFDAKGRLYSGTNGKMQAVYFLQGAYYQKSFGKHGPHTNPYAFDYFHGLPIEGDERRLVQQWLPYEGGAMPGYEGHFFGVNCLANRVAVLDLQPDGSTFRSRELAAAIESNDVWFRPVHAALGPDGAVYVADFYDARITHVDPRDNWDRDHGRIYRLRSEDHPPHPAIDLESKAPEDLLAFLEHPNQWHRATARRLLGERGDHRLGEPLRDLLVQTRQPHSSLEALWTLHLMEALSPEVALAALRHPDPHVQLWAVRLLADRKEPLEDQVFAQVLSLARTDDPRVASQLASSLQRIPTDQALPLLGAVLQQERFSSDPCIPSQLWWGLETHVTADTDKVLAWLESHSDLWATPIVETKLAGLLARRLAADPTPQNLDHAARLLGFAPPSASGILIQGMQHALEGITVTEVPPSLDTALAHLAQSDPDNVQLITFGLRLGGENALKTALTLARAPGGGATPEERVTLINNLAQTGSPQCTELFLELLADPESPLTLRRAALDGLRRASDPDILERLLDLVQEPALEEGLRQGALRVLAGRPAWASHLVALVAEGVLPRESLGIDLLLMMQGHGDEVLKEEIRRLWGTLRQPDAVKQARLRHIRTLLETRQGDSRAGEAVFTATCAACHRLFQRGSDIGPDLTGYERGNLDFLITAVVDPNLGVREEFELTTVTLRPQDGATDGAVLSGFVKALTDTQLTLQDLSGQETVLARADIVQQENSPVSIMPEGLLTTLTETQIRDLFAYLQAPSDPVP